MRDRVFTIRTPDNHAFQLLRHSFVMDLGHLVHIWDVQSHGFLQAQYKILPRYLESLNCEWKGLGFDPLVDQFMFLVPHVMARSAVHRSEKEAR